MTGAEHHREAERLIATVADMPQFEDGTSPWASRALAAAQAHATLALAAATALLGPVAASGYDDADLDAWREAAGTKPASGQCACDHHGDHAGCGADCECGR